MKDKLQEFIQANRHAFDPATPGEQVWSSVRRTLERLPSAGAAERFVLLHRALLDTAEPPEGVWADIEKNLSPADPLESFIRGNRDAFDLETPDLRVWAGVEQAVKKAPEERTGNPLKISWNRHLLRAAAAIALLITGAGLGLWYAGASKAGAGGMTLAQVSNEYAELEGFYQRDIAVKQQKLVAFTGNSGGDVQEDLHQLDAVMAELQQELANVPPGNREQVVRAMIENYKAKAAILERVLERVQGQNTSPETKINSNKHETESI